MKAIKWGKPKPFARPQGIPDMGGELTQTGSQRKFWRTLGNTVQLGVLDV